MLRDAGTHRDYLTTPQAAKRSGLSMVHIRRLITKGQLDGFQIGRDWLVYTDSLEKYMATPHKPGPKGPIKKKKQDIAEELRSLQQG